MSPCPPEAVGTCPGEARGAMTCLLGGTALGGPCWVEAHFHPAVTHTWPTGGDSRVGCQRAQDRANLLPSPQTTWTLLPHSVFRDLSPQGETETSPETAEWVHGQGMAVMARTFHPNVSLFSFEQLSGRGRAMPHPPISIPTGSAHSCAEGASYVLSSADGEAVCQTGLGRAGPHPPLPSTDAGGRSGWWGVCSLCVSIKSKGGGDRSDLKSKAKCEAGDGSPDCCWR